MEESVENSVTLTLSWCYAISFMISLYWQVFSTWRWRSSAGLSFEWVQFTFFGYVSFFLLSWWMYFSKESHDTFDDKFPGVIYPIHISDIILSANGFFTTILIMIQHIRYRRDISRKYSVLGILILILMWFTFFFLGLLALIPGTNLDTTTYFRAVAVMFAVSVAFRYIPQISLIFRMRSTKGWSMELVYCQFIGACFLLTKVIFDGIASSWNIYTGNLVQLVIAIFVLFYSVIIILQRFTCCSDKEMKPSRQQIITEQAILSDRIYYEDEYPPRPQIKPHKIFEEYDPDVVGRVTETKDKRLSRTSMTSSFSASDSDWDYRTDDDISGFPL